MDCPRCGVKMGKEKMCSYCGYSSHKGLSTSAAKANSQRVMTAQPAPRESGSHLPGSPAKFEKETSGTILTSSSPIPPSELGPVPKDHDRCESSISPLFWIIIIGITALLIWALISSLA